MKSITTSQWIKIQHQKREKLLNQYEYEKIALNNFMQFLIFKNHGKKY